MTKKRVLLMLCLPVVVLLLVELGLRLFKPAGELPELDAKFTNDIPGLTRQVAWHQGANGLRADAWPDGGAKILCVGSDNSTPMLQANKDTWWGIVAANLKAQGTQASAGAMGSQGAVAATMLRWVRHVAPDVKPGVVVLSFGPGEVLYRPAGYRIEPGSLETPLSFVPGGWKGTVLQASELAKYWRLSRQSARLAAQQEDLGRDNILRDRMADARLQWSNAPMITELPWVHNPADEIAECLRELAALGKKFNFTPMVLWEPWPQRPDMAAGQSAGFRALTIVRSGDKFVAAKVDPAWVDNRMKAFRMRAQAVADGLGITMVDASDAFDGKPGMFLDDTLWTDAGARAIGTLVTPAMAKVLTAPAAGK